MRKKRVGAKAKTRPAMIAPAVPRPRRRPSTQAPRPQSMHDPSSTRLSASTRSPVSQMTGAASSALPIMFSE